MEIDYTQLKNDLVKELSLEGLSPEKQEEFMTRMTEALLKQVFLSTMDKLGEDGVAEYEKLLESKVSEEEVARFLEARIPNYDAFIETVVSDFKKEMKNSAA